jgi:UDP-N-acetylmuramate dehydrogenase
MQVTENVPLASLTTFKIGGNARYVAACETLEDIQTALTYARERSLSWYVIGSGSNLLVSDAGYDGLIIRPLLQELVFEADATNKESCVVTAGAGVPWDTLVEESVTRGLWGLENLAGIPGLVGGAPVQNIGAYGADVSGTLLYVDALDTKKLLVTRFTKDECGFEYRESRFKHDPSLIILRTAFLLSYDGAPHISYADLTAYQEAVLDTPQSIAAAVRTIRAKKFPDLHTHGTAGSFFKNPIITSEKYIELKALHPELPGFVVPEGVKIPLAWILDHVLQLRGFSKGPVRLFENQPLVVTSQIGATQSDVDVLARKVEELVKDKTGISIEREVRMLS